MNNLKMKHQWLSLLSRLGIKPKSVGVERDNRTQKQMGIVPSGQNVSRHRDAKESDSIVPVFFQNDDRPLVMPTLTRPSEDPSPVEGQRSVNEQAYDYDVRKLI